MKWNIVVAITGASGVTYSIRLLEVLCAAGCDVHLTHMPTPGDEKALRRLGVNLTCDPQFASDKLFVS